MNPLMKALLKRIAGIRGEPNLNDLLDRSDAVLAEAASDPLAPARNSKRRHSFATGSPMEELGARQIPRMLPKMVRQLGSFRASMREAKRHFPLAPRPANEATRGLIAARLRELGALEFGFAEIPDYAVFRDKVAPYRNAVVFTREMDRGAMRAAPSFQCLIEVQNAYGRAGVIANRLTRYLRRLGYNAIPGHPLGGVVDYPLLGRLAGLGELGRNGLLISKSRGCSQRIAVVYTDMTGLDFGEKEDYSWVKDFCAACGKCVRVCPVGALYPEYREDESGQLTSTDGNACLPYFHKHFGCSVCVGVCPFTLTDYPLLKQAWLRGLKGDNSIPAPPG